MITFVCGQVCTHYHDSMYFNLKSSAPFSSLSMTLRFWLTFYEVSSTLFPTDLLLECIAG